MTLRKVDSQNSHSPPLGIEAGQWLLRFEDAESDLDDPYSDPAVRNEAFLDWLATSPRHVQAFLEVYETYQRLAGVDRQARINIRELLQKKHSDVARIYGTEPRVATQAPAPASRRKLQRIGTGIDAGIAVVAAAVILFAVNPFASQAYVTAIGEQHTWKLDDGSTVYLNTDSRIETNFSKQERVVQFVRGEALFVVEHDSHRPFIVRSGHAVVQAVGTQFNVRARGEATDIAVVEGVVQVSAIDVAEPDPQPPLLNLAASPPQTAGAATDIAKRPSTSTRLAAGHEARVERGEVTERVGAQVSDTLSWRERRLIFHDASLAEVANEFNRYNRAKIRVETSAAQEKRLTAISDADRPQALILYSARDESLTIEPEGSNWVIRSR
jgi:transmembrane sensor